MKQFNKYAALNKLDNKNNKKTKRNSIIVCAIVLIFAILYFSFARFESNQTFSLINGTLIIPPPLAKNKLISLAASGANDLRYDGVSTFGENGTPDNNLRYIGRNPNNYVSFNNERWRIIGLMNSVENKEGDVQPLVKIIRDKHVGSSYSIDTSGLNGQWGTNQWGESTYANGNIYAGAQLMQELNNDYLGNITIGTDGKWYNGTNYYKRAEMPSERFGELAQSMIEEVKWNTGATYYDTGNSISLIDFYNGERSNNTEKICTNGTTCDDTVIRTSSWTGKIALMYLSDLGYAIEDINISDVNECLTDITVWQDRTICISYNWLTNLYDDSRSRWTMSPIQSSSSSYAYAFINQTHYMIASGAAQIALVNPVVYLKSTVRIQSGDGSKSNPYILVLNE